VSEVVTSIATREVRWGVGGRMIVDGVTLAVPVGATLGLLGPNGSGKSSLLRLICGLRKVASGVVTLDGTNIRDLGRGAMARRVAFVDQHATTESPVTVLDIVRLGRTPHRGPLAAWTVQDEAAVTQALADVSLEARGAQRWDTLSGGERQRAQIARALAQCPTELLLDEPTNHLDIRHQLEILAIVSALPATSIVALHDLNLAAMFCDSVALLHHGRVVVAGTPEQVLTEANIADVFGVRTSVRPSPHHGRPVIQFLPAFL
jgi:iron complex transport system ATP-binding protein